MIVTAGAPDLPPTVPAEQGGKLLDARPYGPINEQADVTAYEEANDPDGQGVDSNPYSVLALRGRTLVADAAGNSIVSVNDSGQISTFAVLPNITTGLCADVPNDAGTTGCDFVPTSLALGPDGAIYVGGLGAETPGAGSVAKLDPDTGAILQTWDGLFTVTGVAVGRDGAIYASELFGGDPSAPVPGQLTRYLGRRLPHEQGGAVPRRRCGRQVQQRLRGGVLGSTRGGLGHSGSGHVRSDLASPLLSS